MEEQIVPFFAKPRYLCENAGRYRTFGVHSLDHVSMVCCNAFCRISKLPVIGYTWILISHTHNHLTSHQQDLVFKVYISYQDPVFKIRY